MCRSLEILDLIAKVVGATDEQQVAMGLKVPQGSILGSLFRGVLFSPSLPTGASVARPEGSSQVSCETLLRGVVSINRCVRQLISPSCLSVSWRRKVRWN